MVRVAVLEAKVKLISLTIKGLIAILIAEAVAYFLRGVT
jgi:hypothetical protein